MGSKSQPTTQGKIMGTIKLKTNFAGRWQPSVDGAEVLVTGAPTASAAATAANLTMILLPFGLATPPQLDFAKLGSGRTVNLYSQQ